jgi:hypothetical protein
LEERFASSAVLVLGFSGADLALADDYLRLKAASRHTPWLRWLIRPGQQPHAEADKVVRLCGSRGAFFYGDLPDALSQFGIAVPPVHPARIPAAEDRLRTAVSQWLDEPGVDADVCGIVLARLLDDVNVRSGAQAIRSTIRARAARRLRTGVGVAEALRCVLVLGQVAADATDGDPARALRDLKLARRAAEAAVARLRERKPLSPEAQADHTHNLVALTQNMAYCLVRLNDAAGAEQHRDEGLRLMASITGTRLLNHQASDRELAGAIAFLRGKHGVARREWTAALNLAQGNGDLRRTRAVQHNLEIMDGPSART